VEILIQAVSLTVGSFNKQYNFVMKQGKYT
jgi:hypothetical protein